MTLIPRMMTRLMPALAATLVMTLATGTADAGANRLSQWPPGCKAEANGITTCQGTMAGLRALGDATAFAQFAADSWGMYFFMRLAGKDHFCVAQASMANLWQMASAGNATFIVSYNTAGQCTYVWTANGSGNKNASAL
jgi:hypothetical protein